MLYVGGTNARDVITFTTANRNGNRIKVTLGSQVLGTFAPQKIVAYGHKGNDTNSFACHFGKTIVQPNLAARIFGGFGNDVLSAAASRVSVMLVGNAGNDQLIGSSARDMLVGGAGRDYLTGGDGDDILIAGSTSYDSDFSALNELMATWIGPGTYSARRFPPASLTPLDCKMPGPTVPSSNTTP